LAYFKVRIIGADDEKVRTRCFLNTGWPRGHVRWHSRLYRQILFLVRLTLARWCHSRAESHANFTWRK